MHVIKFDIGEKSAKYKQVLILNPQNYSPTKEYQRGNQVSFWPLCLHYGAAAISAVTHGGEFLYLRTLL